MKQSKIYRKLLSVALAAIMVLSLTNGLSVGKARAAEDGGYRLTWEEVENNGKGLLYGRNKTEAAFEENYVKNGMVRVSILLEGDATLKKFPAKNIAANAAATSYRAGLRAKQDEMAQTISRKVLNGEKLDVVWNITLAANIISANIPYEKLDAVRNIIGVKDVVLETRYEALVASKDENDPNMSTASEMVGGNFAWAAGLTGAGSKIAIVDTGLDLEHQSFNGAAFEESLKGKTVDLLEAAEVASVFSSLNAARFLSGADGIYRSAKVPYGVNYVDKGLDVTHMGDRQGEHGSHVAGIAAANSLIPDGNGGFKNALETVKTQGEAPDAQLLIMKVFGKGGGTSDSDYMVAIEDAILLGADAVNLSLGSGNPGLVTNNTYNRILTEVAEATNLVWCNSAGNSYNWAMAMTSALRPAAAPRLTHRPSLLPPWSTRVRPARASRQPMCLRFIMKAQHTATRPSPPSQASMTTYSLTAPAWMTITTWVRPETTSWRLARESLKERLHSATAVLPLSSPRQMPQRSRARKPLSSSTMLQASSASTLPATPNMFRSFRF